jgi:hypothetical protein
LLFRFVLGAGGWQRSHLPRPSTASKPHCLPEQPFLLSIRATLDHSLLRLCWPHLLARPEPSGHGPSLTPPIGQWQPQTPVIPSNATTGDGRTVCATSIQSIKPTGLIDIKPDHHGTDTSF